MADMDFPGSEVTVVHYGERNETLARELGLRGAELNELCVYEWRLPDDLGPLQDMARAVVSARSMPSFSRARFSGSTC